MGETGQPAEEMQMRRLHATHLWRPLHGRRQRQQEVIALHDLHTTQQAESIAKSPLHLANTPENVPIVHEHFQIHNVCSGVLVLEISGLAQLSAEKAIDLAIAQEPMLCWRMMLSGEDRMYLPSQKEDLHLQSKRIALLHEPQISSQVILRPGQQRHINLLITRVGLYNLVQDTPLPTILEIFMQSGDAPLLWQHDLSLAQQRIAWEIVHANKQDPLYRLFLRCKVMELMLEWFRLLAREEVPSFSSYAVTKEQRLLEEACARLQHLPHAVPTVEELARQLDTTPRKLNELFRHHHGTTIFEWFADWKMKRAFELLQNSNRPIKEIAFSLGYQHVNNFTLAFTRYFGTPPARMRKGACE
ncbi:helix-turn-helix transcriptional regulator [Candidatus Magnetaquicoccus inordinatus]|uniref:helix-turn-helix transcriptional regulator n=1 Tax=Candidatus Magnetaquicoccus inordinatus TaxID=2496818 RepID=UPI00102CDE27|nr:AraC family transcriptional regulator [Candidatus Magnetaquicoccus inordinatus]